MPSLTTFILATILALAIVPAPQAQKQSPPEEKTVCGTVIPPEQLKAELARRAKSARKNSVALAAPPPADAPYYLPLTIHMVHDDNNIHGGLPPGQLEAVMQNLNRMWRQVGIQFFIFGEIDHSIHDDTLFRAITDETRDALLRVNVVPNTINVYFAKLGNICGRGTFTGQDVQGVLLDIDCMDGIGVDPAGLEVFAHEMGHYFDLLHTHETNFGVECPSGNNCSTAGDLLCDTPADPGLQDGIGFRVNPDCSYDNSATTPTTCDDTRYNPPTTNLMSYSIGACQNQFTPNQISKVLQTLRENNKRKNLITSGVRYVDPLASNSNTNCTYNAPCRTPAKAIQAAKDGEFIFLKPGVHRASSLGGKQVTLNRWGNAGVVEILP